MVGSGQQGIGYEDDDDDDYDDAGICRVLSEGCALSVFSNTTCSAVSFSSLSLLFVGCEDCFELCRSVSGRQASLPCEALHLPAALSLKHLAIHGDIMSVRSGYRRRAPSCLPAPWSCPTGGVAKEPCSAVSAKKGPRYIGRQCSNTFASVLSVHCIYMSIHSVP